MNVHYVTGSRADFGLMTRCLQTLHADPDIDLSLVVTGQHMVKDYGNTADDVTATGIPIASQIPVDLLGLDGAEMGKAMATELAGFLTLWQKNRPDVVLVLGDRGEMVAAALAAVHLGIFVAHIHGGERSGTLDESFRHVISKLAHYHFPATQDAADRLRKMGEADHAITVIGAPGLVGITDGVQADKNTLTEHFGLPTQGPHALTVFHPVVQESQNAGSQVQVLLETLQSEGISSVIFRPNSDAGGEQINAVLDQFEGLPQFHFLTHLPRDMYLKVLASMDVMIGNSSSGIIESASLQVPCVNLGTRQDNRLRNTNTVDSVNFSRHTVGQAISQALSLQPPFINAYGDGTTDHRLCDALKSLSLNPDDLKKCNSY